MESGEAEDFAFALEEARPGGRPGRSLCKLFASTGLHPGSASGGNRPGQGRTRGYPGGNTAEAAQGLQGAGTLVDIEGA